MKIFKILLLSLLISNNLFSKDIYSTSEFELNFSSNNINLTKETKINEIKIRSFQNIIQQILTKKNIKKINLDDINFINSFILNYKINDEKIINNNYFANIKINFNKKKFIDYFIENNIDFIDKTLSKFLIIILENNDLNTHLLSEDNSYYKYLNKSNNNFLKNIFLIPNLDFNDRFLFNEYHFTNEVFKQNNLLNRKYNTEYQILVHSIKKNNLLIYDIHLFYNNQKYFVSKIPVNNLNYEKLFNSIFSKTVNKWKEINQINTSLVNSFTCKIIINNVNELQYVRNLLKSNFLIKNLNLKSIKLNNNLYSITYIGSFENFQNSLKVNRLNLFNRNNLCNIELI